MWSSISKLDRSLILLFVQNYLLVLWNSHDNFGVGLYSKTWVLPMAHTLLVCLQPSSSPLVIRGTDMMRSCILVLSTCLCQSLVSLLLYHARTYSKCFFNSARRPSTCPNRKCWALFWLTGTSTCPHTAGTSNTTCHTRYLAPAPLHLSNNQTLYVKILGRPR